MRILFALPGLHRVRRGAEVAFEAVAQEIAAEGTHSVTLAGSGPVLPRPYNFVQVPAVPRERFERWPKLPPFRSEHAYEDFTFAIGLLRRGLHRHFDVTVTCSYPFTNMALRSRPVRTRRPAHVFVTQNGDWPAFNRTREYRFFGCEGLVCTNPLYYERNRRNWFSTLIPNGIYPNRFSPGPSERATLGLPEGKRVILMVSALEEGKRVLQAIRAVARIPDAFLVIAGNGTLRSEVDRLAAALLPGRFLRTMYLYEQMPLLYRSANVFLHTALQESFGNVYLEALASGVPIVANDDAVTRWILGDNATLVDVTSESLLITGLEAALSMPRENVMQASSMARETYAWNAIARRYGEFLTQAVEHSQGKPLDAQGSVVK